MRESSVRNSPLPPSVEKAYHKKCIELKGRLNEIEDANNAARLRKRRVDRSIMKMRLERAFLLERLAKIQYSNADESDKSSSPPPAVCCSTSLLLNHAQAGHPSPPLLHNLESPQVTNHHPSQDTGATTAPTPVTQEPTHSRQPS